MKIRRYWFKACLIVFLVTMATGCNRGSERTEKSTVPAAANAPKPASSPAAGEPLAALGVMIAPDSPVRRDTLRAVSTGSVPIESYRWEIDNQSIEEESASLPPGLARKGETVTVIATGQGREAQDSVQIVNSPPKVMDLPFTPADFYQGIDITVTPRANDPDDDPVEFDFVWFRNDEVMPGEKSPTLSGLSFRRGDRIAIQVIPFDGTDHGEPFLSRAVVVPNASPDIVSTPPVNFKSRVYRYQVRAEDVDGDSLTYVLETGPAGMVINETSGQIVWPIGADQSGEHKVKIVVADAIQAVAFQEYTITISLTEQATN